MPQILLPQTTALAEVLKGIKIVADEVRVSYGPNGRTYGIGNQYGGPTITRDGVTIAESIDIKPTVKNKGIRDGSEWAKQAARLLNTEVGDFTSGVCILMDELAKECYKLIAAGYDANQLARDLINSYQSIESYLKTLSEPITKNNQLTRLAEVATISAKDPAIGKLVAEVFNKIGADGVVTVESGAGLATSKDIIKGYTFDQGYISPFCVTDAARMEAIADEIHILVTDKKISSLYEFEPFVAKLRKANINRLVIIADEIEGDVLPALILSRQGATLPNGQTLPPFYSIAIKAPGFGDHKKDMLQDIATIAGATLISNEKTVWDGDQQVPMSFANIGLDVLGSAKKVTCSRKQTTIIGGAGNNKDVAKRVTEIKAQAKTAEAEYTKDTLSKRAAALNGEVAVIRVGGLTQTDIKNKKFDIDDAISTARAALQEGIVPGGDITFIHIANHLNGSPYSNAASVLYRALQQPFIQLMKNAGKNAEYLLAKVQEDETKTLGINLYNNDDELVDLKAQGVIDSTKGTREAIKAAISIVANVITLGGFNAYYEEAQNESNRYNNY